MTTSVEEIRKAQRAQGPATILAIGTATPSNCFYHADYPDYYFRVTNSNDMTQLKQKFKRICEKSMIKKRYMHLTEEILKENPNMCAQMAPSLNARQDIMLVEVSKLGKEAAIKAINEWGQPKSKITDLIFCTTSGIDIPGADYQLTNLLELRPSVKRVMMYMHGCYGGGATLRVAKDLAKNNKGARVLVVCTELASFLIRGPSDTEIDCLIGQALFSDGAAAVIVGADPDTRIERPLFELVLAAQTFLPDSKGDMYGHVREAGIIFHFSRRVLELISNNIEKSLVEAFSPIDINDWNSIFWIVHPGGQAILDQVEEKLGLKQEKLRASRHVLAEYGNMSSPSVLFVMDEMRKKSAEQGMATTGEGLDWGVFFSLGPSITVETIVLHSIKI